MAFEEVEWVAFADTAEGRLTVLSAELDLYPGSVSLNAELSDARLQVYGLGDTVLALVATLAPATGGADDRNFAEAVTHLIRERVGLNIARTMTGTEFYANSHNGTFAWRIGPTADTEPGQ